MSFSFYFHTLRYLKPRQFLWRLFFLLRRRLGWSAQRLYLKLFSSAEADSAATSLRDRLSTAPPFAAPLPTTAAADLSYEPPGRFSVLNIGHDFGDLSAIDFDFADHGKLWCYHLNYFDCLHSLDSDTAHSLLRHHTTLLPQLRNALEPYPLSLRILNTTAFLLRSPPPPDEPTLWRSLFAQSALLLDQREFHLLGNHLLENLLALFVAVRLFDQPRWLAAICRDLLHELSEQTLADGAHFERSPMYHRILLGRILLALQLDRHLPEAERLPPEPLAQLRGGLQSTAAAMLFYLDRFDSLLINDEPPHLNDSIAGAAPTLSQLRLTAESLCLSPSTSEPPTTPADSCYTRLSRGRFSLLADLDPIGPDYIPGHAHADMLSFWLFYDGRPLIAEVGTSTYLPGEQRNFERSTAAHSTIEIGGLDQSEVWGGFRVARRARIVERSLSEQGERVVASAAHDGYRQRFGLIHQRRFELSSAGLTIRDRLTGTSASASNPQPTAVARLWFAPGVDLRQLDDHRFAIGEQWQLRIDGASRITIEPGRVAVGWNRYADSLCLMAELESELTTTII